MEEDFGEGFCKEEYSSALSGWEVGLCGYCAYHCKIYVGLKEDLGDGVCKEECNTKACEYDVGDCGGPIQVSCNSECQEEMLGDGVCQKKCLNPACENDRGDCAFLACNADCYDYMIGDGLCQESCQVKECQWDMNDCYCSPGCPAALLTNTECDELCNTPACGFDNGACASLKLDCAAGCLKAMIGNGVCDKDCYHAECGWDGWDCGCAPACKFSEIAECKLECLVIDCGYGDLPGHLPCDDTIKRLSQRFNDIITFQGTTAFPATLIDPSQACKPPWGMEPWENTFYYCSSNFFYSSAPECLYNTGMCNPPTDICKRDYLLGCMQCVPGLVNFAGQCLFECPYGSSPHAVVPDICVAAPSYAAITLYVSPKYAGGDSDGSWKKPYNALEDTLHMWINYNVTILLIGPSHSIGSSIPRYLPRLYDKVSDMTAHHSRNITISPYECEGKTECQRPTVLVSGSLRIMNPWNGLNCKEWKKNVFLRFENINFEENSSNLIPFSEFLMLDRGTLSLVNVTFTHFPTVTSLITFGASVRIQLWNVDFYDVIASQAVFQAATDSDEGHHNCEEYFPFSSQFTLSHFTYEIGKITFAQALAQPTTFLKHIYMGTVLIANVTLAGWVCPTGCFFVNADSWAYFEMRNCLFADNVMGSGFFLWVNSTNWKFRTEGMAQSQGSEGPVGVRARKTTLQRRGGMIIDIVVEETVLVVSKYLSQQNYNISSCIFRNNSFTTGNPIAFTFPALMQNVLMERLSFLQNSAVLISISSSLPPAKLRIYGPAYIDFNTNQRVSFPPALISMQHIEITTCSSPFPGLIYLKQLPHVAVNVRISGIDRGTGYCFPAIMLEGNYNFTMIGSAIEKITCENGTAGLVALNSTGPITIQNSRFSDLISQSEQGSAISITASASVFLRGVSISNSENRGCGAVYASELAFLWLGECIVERNKASEGGVLCLGNIVEVVIEASSFRYNNASSGGAIQLTSSSSIPASLAISTSAFEWNQADSQGGTLSVTYVPPAVLFRLAIHDSLFANNTAESGAVLYLSSRIQLQAPSYLSNVTISHNHASQGAIALNYQSGTLAMSSMLFADNIGESESCLYVKFSYSSGALQNIISIENSLFVRNSGQYTFRFPYAVTGILFLLTNVTVENNAGTGFQLANSILNCSNSVFRSNAGTAISLSRVSTAVLREVKFEGNEAEKDAAGVQLEGQSSLLCNGCVFMGNKGQGNGGAVQAEGSSAVTMLDSEFTGNTANEGSALKLLLANVSSLTNCSFIANYAAVEGTVVLMSTSLTLTNCLFSRNAAVKAAGLISIESILKLIDCRLENQSGDAGYFLLITSLSYADLINTSISHGESLQEGAVYVEESTILLLNCVLTDIIGRKGALLYAYGNANVTFQYNQISSSTALQSALVYLWLSTGYIHHSNFSSYQGTAVIAQECTLLLTHSSFTEGFGEAGTGIRCLQCVHMSLQNSQFTHLEADTGGAVEMEGGQESILTIVKCNFGFNKAGQGGAIYAQEGHLDILESAFVNNSAFQISSDQLPIGTGGAVAFLHSDLSLLCSLAIKQSRFINNYAEVKGGAIAWQGENYFPSFVNHTYEGNIAPYGPNISSFPVSIISSAGDLPVSTSGQPFPISLNFSLIDHYGQIVSSDNSTKAGLTVNGSLATIYGHSETTASQGLLTFDSFNIAATPGTNVTIAAVVPGLSSLHQLTVYLRLCEPGESQVEEKCQLCRAPKYSFSPSESCKDCPSEAICTGGANVYPRAGYWRYNWLSTTFLQCSNPAACLSPTEATNTTTCAEDSSCPKQDSALSKTGTCLPGYTGNMCQTCAIDYHRTSKIWCQPCPSDSSSITLSIAYVLSVTAFCVFIVATSIKSGSSRQALHSVYLKVLMNYFQLVMLMGSFNLSWPTLMKKMLDIQDSAGSFSEHMFTTDCLEDNFDENEAFYQKLLLLSASPIVFFVISSVFWVLLAACKQSISMLKNELVASGIILFFLLHPSVMRVMFNAFNCEEVRPGEYWVTGLLVKCWEGKHLTYALAVALPAILIWGIGIPGIILGNLMRNRENLRDKSVSTRFGFMIKGYSASQYYWEFIIIYRKLLIISIATFLSRIAKMTQALCALSVLVFSLGLQNHYHPYSHPSLNTMEQRSILVSVATIFFGLYYLDSSLSKGWEFFFFAITLGVNVYFLQFWMRKIVSAFFVLAVKRVNWLNMHFVAINETVAVSRQAFIAKSKTNVSALHRKGRRHLGIVSKDLYIRKLLQQ